jgi:hypothetical protein
MIEAIAKLHPAAQVAVVVMLGLVVITWLYTMSRFMR